MTGGRDERMSMLRLKDFLLPLLPVALIACDQATEPEAPDAVPPQDRPAAAQPAPSKDVQLTPKHKPVVMDLGGAQAAQAVGCDLTVRFGSIGTGTDNVAGARISRLIEEDPGVAQIERFIVGREGETVTCIRLKTEAEADHLFDKLLEAAADAYLVTIRSASGREFHSPRQRL
jgi:hypothetical protein